MEGADVSTAGDAEIRASLREGAAFFVGAFDPVSLAKKAAGSLSIFVRPSAFFLDLPNEDMAFCELIFGHYLPRSHALPPTTEQIDAWFQRLWATLSLLGAYPTSRVLFDTETGFLTFHMTWKEEVMAEIPLTVARDLERAVLSHGGRMTADGRPPESGPVVTISSEEATAPGSEPRLGPAPVPEPQESWECGHPRGRGTTQCWQPSCLRAGPAPAPTLSAAAVPGPLVAAPEDEGPSGYVWLLRLAAAAFVAWLLWTCLQS
jgi:hypothetical protein